MRFENIKNNSKRYTMKKIFLMILILTFILVLPSCGKVDFDLSDMDTHTAIDLINVIKGRMDINEGKTIKITGKFEIAEYNNVKTYKVALIDDGHGHYTYLNFIIKEGETYPIPGSKITVTGKLAKYVKDGYTECRIEEAKVKVIESAPEIAGKVDYDFSSQNKDISLDFLDSINENGYEEHIGKIVKMTGSFYANQKEDKTYYSLLIMVDDRANGIEFILENSNLKYPDDYPKNGEEITIIGTFDTYKEGENTFCHLKSAVIVD